MIRVFATGGTIASSVRASTISYAPTLSGADLVAQALARANLYISTHVVEVTSKTSFMLETADVENLLAQIHDAVRDPDVTGVVLVMGTAAMEEVGFLLDLTVERSKPVALTGAMLNASHPGWDGLRNLADALRLVTDPVSQSLGSVVVMAGAAHAARDVQKVHRNSIDAFRSEPAGPLALIDADRITVLRQPREQPTFSVAQLGGPVDIVTSSLAGDGRLMRAAVASGAKGVVVQGFPGGGGVSPQLMTEICSALAAGLPVVLVSRSPFGRTIPGAGGGSGPADIAAAGAILAGDLNAAKARLLLLCALAEGRMIDGIRSAFTAIAP